MSNNLHRVQNIFISDGSAFPANNAAISGLTAGKIGVYGQNMLALDPGAADTYTTEPVIYIAESKTDSSGAAYIKRSSRIDGASVITIKGESYVPDQREVWTIGYNRKTAAGSIDANSSTVYTFAIRFKNDKWMYSERPEVLRVSFTSSSSATQSNIADQIAGAINSSAFKNQIVAVRVGDGTGLYGRTAASNFGVEITSASVNQYLTTTYTPNIVRFSVHVDDSTGFTSVTTCTQINAAKQGTGTFNQVRMLENKAFSYEGVLNRTLWPIPELDYSSSSTFVLSAAIGVNTTGTSGEDTVTFASTVASILRVGEEVEIDSVNYKIKYFISATVAVLTSVLTTSPGTADVTKVRVKYDLVTIEFNDRINTPTGTPAISNKTVILASPSLDTGDAYNGISGASQDIMDVINTWSATVPGAFAAISI